jgi:coenzyme F420-reducing hydrogenase beta subunit
LAHTYIEGTEYVIRDRFGFKLEEVEGIAFRGGEYPGRFTVWSKTGEVKSMDLMALWGMAPTMFIGFPVERCYVCLDHVAELANISAGDAWGRTDLMEEGIKVGNAVRIRYRQKYGWPVPRVE